MKPQPVLAVLAASLFAGNYASAYPIVVDEEKGIAVNVGVLVQPWFQLTAPGSEGRGSAGIGAPDGSSPSFDFFMRRARLMVWGSVNKELSYFIETDQPNWGKGGNYTSATIVQDAFLSYAFAPEFKIDVGMMLLPFSHHTMEGAVGLNALDYHADVIRLPGAFIFRDIGVQFRGLLLDNMLYYRAGIFNGVRGTRPTPGMMPPPPPALNDNGLPRLTGQVRLNLMGAEPDFFLKGIYFAANPMMSIGVGADYQGKAVLKNDGQPGAYFALSGDVFVDYPLSAEDELVVKANVFLYPEGTPFLTRGGTAFYVEAGFRHEWIEPLAFIDYAAGKGGSVTLLAPHAGANFWVNKHTFNVKADIGYRKLDVTSAAGVTTTTKDILATVQTQLFF